MLAAFLCRASPFLVLNSRRAPSRFRFASRLHLLLNGNQARITGGFGIFHFLSRKNCAAADKKFAGLGTHTFPLRPALFPPGAIQPASGLNVLDFEALVLQSEEHLVQGPSGDDEIVRAVVGNGVSWRHPIGGRQVTILLQAPTRGGIEPGNDNGVGRREGNSR